MPTLVFFACCSRDTIHAVTVCCGGDHCGRYDITVDDTAGVGIFGRMENFLLSSTIAHLWVLLLHFPYFARAQLDIELISAISKCLSLIEFSPSRHP